MVDLKTPCPECGAYKGHAVDCSKMNKKELREQLDIYYKAYQESLKVVLKERKENPTKLLKLQKKFLRLMKERNEVKGKLYDIKKENNALRRKHHLMLESKKRFEKILVGTLNAERENLFQINIMLEKKRSVMSREEAAMWVQKKDSLEGTIDNLIYLYKVYQNNE